MNSTSHHISPRGVRVGLQSIGRFLSLLTVYFLFPACITELDVDLPTAESQLVVEGYMTSGDSALIRIGESQNYFVPQDYDSTDGANALVVLEVSGQEYLLSDVTVPWDDIRFAYGSMFGRYYSLSKQVLTLPPSGSLKLRVTYQGRTATSSAEIPSLIRIDSFRVVPYQLRYGYIHDVFLSAKFPVGVSYFLVELKSDTMFPNTFYDQWMLNEVIEVDGTGGPITVQVVNGRQWGTDRDIHSWFLRLSHISAAYYRFAREIDEQRTGDQNEFGLQGVEPTEIHGNIVGGFGIFTSMTVDSMRMRD